MEQAVNYWQYKDVVTFASAFGPLSDDPRYMLPLRLSGPGQRGADGAGAAAQTKRRLAARVE